MRRTQSSAAGDRPSRRCVGRSSRYSQSARAQCLRRGRADQLQRVVTPIRDDQARAATVPRVGSLSTSNLWSVNRPLEGGANAVDGRTARAVVEELFECVGVDLRAKRCPLRIAERPPTGKSIAHLVNRSRTVAAQRPSQAAKKRSRSWRIQWPRCQRQRSFGRRSKRSPRAAMTVSRHAKVRSPVDVRETAFRNSCRQVKSRRFQDSKYLGIDQSIARL